MNASSLRQAQAFLDSWLAYRASQLDIPGFSVAIYHHDDVVFSRAYGVADIEHNQPLTTRHRFGAASQTKMFTATAILQLSNQGKLHLDDAASKYLPWLTKHQDPRFSKITIQQLLSHHSGIMRDGQDASYWQLEQAFPDAAKFRRAIYSAHITTETTGQIKYSNLGFALLGQVIKRASGQSYASYLTQNIIRPLKLTATTADFTPRIIKHLATGYSIPFDGRRQATPQHESVRALAGAVGVYTTPDDLCHFAAAHFPGNPSLLSDHLKTLAQTTHSAGTDYDEGTEFGLGFEITTVDNRRLVGHGGHMAGYSTATYFDPKARLAVSVMTNCKDGPAVQIMRGVFETLGFFERHAARPAPARLARLSARLSSRFAAIEVVTTQDRSVAIDPDDWSPFAWPEELTYVNPTTLRITTPGSIFNRNELLRYTFDQETLKAVNYAGFNLLPEPTYRAGSFNHPANQPPISLGDLQHTNLRIGKIISLHKGSRSDPAPYRLTIDFGSDVGQKQAYLHHDLATPMKGQFVLGAIYPVWRATGATEEVLILSITDHYASTPSFPGGLLPLKPDPSIPQILPKQASRERFFQHASEFRKQFFKFEPLPEYSVEDMEYAPSLVSWIKGKRRLAIALMEQEKDNLPAWERKTLNRIRIRVVSDTSNPYLDWELEYFKRLVIPATHETIYLLPEKALRGLELPDGDLHIFDHAQVMINSYKNQHWTHASFYDQAQGNNVTPFLEIKRHLIELAQLYGQKL